MKYRFGIMIFLSAMLMFSCNSKKNEAESKYKNHILLEAKGFKIKEAFLAFNDSTRVADDNKVTIGQHVNLIILVDSGWNAEDGKIYPGVGQKVETNDGTHIFNKPDLMESHPGGIQAEDGSRVTIQAVINSADKNYEYFLVSFRVWDKKSESEITGSYKLHVKL
jgi:hypothetical protein